MKKYTLFLCALCLLLTGCAKTESATVYAMNTVMDFSVTAEHAGDVIAAMTSAVNDLERRLSRTLEGSEVSALNTAGGEEVEVSLPVRSLLETARSLTEATGGAFDVTIAPVASAWGFTESAFRVPSQEELDTLLPLVAAGSISLGQNGETYLAALQPGQNLDLGGIAKGYASDCLGDIFLNSGAERGHVSLGGNVLVWGTKEDGSPWRIGVKDPQNTAAFCAVLELENAYAVTSGGYERCFEEGGVTYHHLLDPSTGYPAQSGLLSVTVVMDWEGQVLEGATGNGTVCDALSTALFVMGEEKALEFWRSGLYDFDMVLVTEDGRLLSTPGLTALPTQESGYTYETVR